MAKLLDIKVSDKTNLDAMRAGLPEVVAKAINRATQSARRVAVAEISEEFAIESSELENRIKVKKATPSRLHAMITVKSRLLSLAKFRAYQFSRGVNVQIKRGAPYRLLPHAFIATMKSGHKGVFTRVGAKRLPIRERVTISIAQMMNTKRISKKISDHIRQKRQSEMTKLVRALDRDTRLPGDPDD